MELLRTKLHQHAVALSLIMKSERRKFSFAKTSWECCSYRYNSSVAKDLGNKCRPKNVLRQPSLFMMSKYHPDSLLNINSLKLQIPVSHFSTSCTRFQDVNLAQGTSDLIFADFPTVQAAESIISGIHDFTGLPWWCTIITSAFILRILLPLPLSIYTMHNEARLQRLQPEIKVLAQQLNKEVNIARQLLKWDEKKARAEFNKDLRRILKILYIRDNCHPMKKVAAYWIRIPLWVSASLALRNISVQANNPLLENYEGYQSLKSEGVAWCMDLTLIDSTWILPIMMGMVTLFNVEMARWNVPQVTTWRKVLTFTLRGLALVFIPISACRSSGIVLYWVSSGTFSAIQTALVDNSTTFRSLIGIKPVISKDKTSSGGMKEEPVLSENQPSLNGMNKEPVKNENQASVIGTEERSITREDKSCQMGSNRSNRSL